MTLLDVQNFDFKVEYQPGNTNPADYNRHPILDDASREGEEESTEIYINAIVHDHNDRCHNDKDATKGTYPDKL